MTVSSPPIPPPAPVPCRLSAETSRSTSPTPNPAGKPTTHQNHLRKAGERGGRGSQHANALSPDEADRLRTRPGRRPRALPRASRLQALELRAAIQDVGARSEPADAPRGRGARRALASLHVRFLRRAALAFSAGRVSVAMVDRSGAGRGGAGPDRAFGRKALHRRRLSIGSSSAAVTPAAGCSTTRPRTTVAGGARWRCAAIAPSRSGSPSGGARA